MKLLFSHFFRFLSGILDSSSYTYYLFNYLINTCTLLIAVFLQKNGISYIINTGGKNRYAENFLYKKYIEKRFFGG